jgi:signal transduction histidine kinase
MFATSVLVATDFSNWTQVFLLSGINLLVIAFCFGLFLVFQRIARRNKSQGTYTLLLPLVVGAILGSLKGFLTALLTEFALETSTDLASFGLRALQTAILGAWLFAGVEILAAKKLQFENTRTELLQEKVKQILSDHPTRDQRPKQLDEFLVSARRMLANIKSKPEMLLTEYAAVIRNDMAMHLRPLSHQLWDDQEISYPKYTFRDLFKAALKSKPFSIPATMVVYSVSGLAYYLNTFGLVVGLPYLLLVVLVLAVALASLSRVQPRHLPGFWLRYLAGVVASVLITSTPEVCLQGIGAANLWLPVAVVNLLWLPSLITITAVAGAAVQANSRVQRELSQATHDDQALVGSAVSALAARNLAQHLHGNVQNKLLAAAMRLESSPEQTDIDLLARELEVVESILDRLERHGEPAEALPLVQVLAATAQNWRFIIDVELPVVSDETLGLIDSSRVRLMGEVINEAIANAFRHGGAATVTVSFETVGLNTWLVVSDDGIGYKPGSRGLGSELYSQFAGSGWSLESLPAQGCKLRLKIS